MILAEILLFMFMIILANLSVIKHMICGSNKSWLLNLHLTYKALHTWAGSGLLISLQEDSISFSLQTWSLWSYWRKNVFQDDDFLSHLNWVDPLTLPPLLKLSPIKLKPWFVLSSFFFLRLAFNSINLPYSLGWNTIAMSQLVLPAANWVR